MKILHIIASVNPAGGGPIEGIKQLAVENQRNGIQVEVASLDHPQADHVASFSLPLHALGPTWLSYGYSQYFVPWLRKNARAYDVVVVNGIWQYHSFGAWRALHDSSTPYVVFTHGMLDPWFNRTYPLKHLKKSLYWPWAEYRVLRDAQAVLFTCEQERELARQSFPLYSAREVVLNYGTTSPAEGQAEQRQAFFEAYPHLRDKRIVLFLGRIHPKKGCDLAIKAFAQVLAADTKWHLVLAGPDSVGWREALSGLAADLRISERLTWTGMLRGQAKLGALRAAEVFLLPSHQENFGIAVAEALACGVPALISNQVNIWHEVQSSGGGIVAPDDLAGTCSLLREWSTMKEDRKTAMRASAVACFHNNFEIKKAGLSLAAFLRTVALRSPVGRTGPGTTENAA